MTWLDYIKTRYQVAELADTQSALESWFDTPLGERILAAERRCCEQTLSGLSGYRLGHLGASPGHDLISCFAMRHRFKLVAGVPGDGSESVDKVLPSNKGNVAPAGFARFDALPLPTETIDAIILHHALDFSPSPHEVLNEAARVVTAGGHLVIIGFNPFSSFGLAKWPGVLLGSNPAWRHHSLRISRIVDWLTLLGFEVTHRQGYFCRPEGNGGRLRQVRAMLNGQSGAFYVLAATKRVTPVMPVVHHGWLPGRLPALVGSRSRRYPFDGKRVA